jgi:hypothetical protein
MFEWSLMIAKWSGIERDELTIDAEVSRWPQEA